MDTAYIISKSSSRQHNGSLFRIGILFFFVAGVFIVASMTDASSVLTTGLLAAIVAVVGNSLIDSVSQKLDDPELRKLGYVWIAKLIMMLVILYLGWRPDLMYETSTSWGYDPQRFYASAKELAESRLQILVPYINYTGVYYYYGTIMLLFGANPLVPLLINALTTLLSVLVLIYIGYQIKVTKSRYDWTLGLVMLFPEVLWYGVMTSKGIISMALITISALVIADQTFALNVFGRWIALVIVGVSAVAMGTIRGSMLIVVAAIALLLIVSSTGKVGRLGKALPVVIILLCALALIPSLSRLTGAYDFSYVDKYSDITSPSTEKVDNRYWNERSIGRMLVPSNKFEAIAFVTPRVFLNIIAPLPRIRFTVQGFLRGRWSDWQALLTTMSSILYIIAMPLAISSTIIALRNTKYRQTFAILVPFWVLLFGTVGGIHTVHPRYRVMVALLFCASAWLGLSCSRKLISYTTIIWFGVLAFAASFYLVYKY